jgi:hypothetical protein
VRSPKDAPAIETADLNTLIEFLRDKRCYLQIDIEMMLVRVKRVYRIWIQEKEHVAESLDEAVRMAARQAYEDLCGVDDWWDGLGKMAALLSKAKVGEATS